jgi:hypothetical protein
VTDTSGRPGRPQLKYSDSARMTWLWASDMAAARQLRADLQAGGQWWGPAQRGREKLPLVTDVEIGVDAMNACQYLAGLGYTFTWHEDVPLYARDGWPAELPGMPARAQD